MAKDTNQITVTHNGIEITYNEDTNWFHFTLRGRDRKCQTLRAARDLIDQPAKDEKPPFKPVKAWCYGHYEGFNPVTITSVAEERYGSVYFWIKDKDGNRSKEASSYIYASTAKNDRLIEVIRKAEAEKAKLEKQIAKVMEELDRVET